MKHGKTVLRWGWLAVVVLAAVVWACSGGGNGGDESVGQSGAADTTHPGATCVQGYLTASAAGPTLHNGSHASTVNSFTIPSTIGVASGSASGLALTLQWSIPSPQSNLSCTYTSSATGDTAVFTFSACSDLPTQSMIVSHPPAGTTYTNPSAFVLTLSGSGTMSLSIPLGSTALDDGKQCTIDRCSADGGVAVTNLPAGTPCGCGSCNDAGTCVPFEPPQDAGSTCNPSLACVSGQWVTQGANTCSVPSHPDGGFNATIATNLVNSAAFLFTGADGGTGSINPTDVAVVRGRVFKNAAVGAGAPTLLQYANVSILGHPEFGSVQTRSDGWYDIAVNGGAPVTVVVVAPAGATTYFPVQRQVPTAWHQYAVVPDIYLTPKDNPNNVNASVAMGSASVQSIQGTTLTDPSDTGAKPHTARVMFPPGTTATYQYGPCTAAGTCPSGGACQTGNVCVDATTPSSVTIHATEYTYGANGPASLPGNLPPSTAYTYAVELNSDEADTKGASLVFASGSPVFFYLENFLNFPLGSNVPVGFYNRATGEWVASPNGDVIAVTGSMTCAGGSGTCAKIAVPDGGSGNPSIPNSELQWLWQTYGSGTLPVQLWRAPIPHFSPWDLNWPMLPSGAGGPPGGGGPAGPPPGPTNDGPLTCGSIIECQNSILAEQFPLYGTPYKLRYQSERASGRAPTLSIPLTGPSIPSTGLISVNVNILISGVSYNLTYPVSELIPNQTLTWPWNRLDAYGNKVEGMQVAQVTVGYVYHATYVTAAARAAIPDFALFPPGDGGQPYTQTANRAASTLTVSQTSFSRIGIQDPEPSGLGGLTVSVNHLYDPDSQMLWGGDGTRRTVGLQVDTVPGSVEPVALGPVATGADGTIFYAMNGTVVRLSPQGVPTTIAGGVGYTYAATPVPATSFNFGSVQGIAVAPNGLIYVASSPLINVIDPVTGLITTVAGLNAGTGNNNLDPTPGCGDDPIATHGSLKTPWGIAVGVDSSLYIADQGCSTLRRLGPDGSLSTVTGPQASVAYVNGTNASKVGLNGPQWVATSPDGSIYVGDSFESGRVTRIDGRTSEVQLIAGGINPVSHPPLSYDGTPAANMPVEATNSIPMLAVASDGTLYFTSTDASKQGGTYPSNVLWHVDNMGIAHLVAGNGALAALGANEGDMGSALNCSFGFPGGLAASPDGSILWAETGNGAPVALAKRVRRVHLGYPGYQAGTGVTMTIPSQDGTELYGFDSTGKHQYTYDAVTGATKLHFTYDGSNRLSTIVDPIVGTTMFTYSPGSVSIQAPLLQTTKLTLDGSAEAAYPAGPGRVTALTFPNTAEITRFAYSRGDGLLTSLTDPIGGAPHAFSYDANGLLIQDTDPTGASKLLYRSGPTTASTDAGVVQAYASWTTTVTNGAGDVVTHQIQALANNTSVYTDSTPSGATRTYTHTSGDVRTIVAPDGTKTVTLMGPDPHYGSSAPFATSVSVTTPAGNQTQTTHTRTWSPLAPPTITDIVTRGPSSGNGQLVTTNDYTANATASTGGTSLVTSTLTGTTNLSRTVQVTLDGLERVTQVQPMSCTAPGSCTAATVPGTSTPMAATTSTFGGARGQLSQTAVGSRAWLYGYDTAGNLYTLEDPVTNTTTYSMHDNDGRVTTTVLPDGVSSVLRNYDLNGNLHTITVPPSTHLPSTHTFNYSPYSPLNLLVSYDPPQTASADGGTPLITLNTSYAYDNDQHLVSVTAPEGSGYETVQRLYERYGRLSSTYDPISNVTASYTYVATPHVTDQVAMVKTSDNVTVTNTYDGFLKTETAWTSPLFSSSVSWTYDALLRPATVSVPNGTLKATFAYADPDGLYTGTTSPAFTVTRDLATGLATGATLGSAVEAWTYDAYGAPATYTVTSGSETLYTLSITSRDSNGRIQDVSETNNGTLYTWGFTYDARGQLASANQSGTTRSYLYDPNGNLTTINGTVVDTYDAQDRLATFKPGRYLNSPTYTNNGDLSSFLTVTYEYDLSGNLRTVTLPEGNNLTSAQYTIDGLNRRVGRAVTGLGTTIEQGFMYDEQGRVIAELSGTSGALSVRSVFVYGLKPNVPDYMIQGGKAYLIVSDWIGSVRQVLDTSTSPATVKETIDYDEWGNILSLSDPSCTGDPCLNFQPFGFAGGIYEPADGFVRFGARDYYPELARWVQKDPILFDGGQENLYVYAGNDPINLADPSGEKICPPPYCYVPGPSPKQKCYEQCYGLAGQVFDNCMNGSPAEPACGDPVACGAAAAAAAASCNGRCAAMP